LDAADAAAAALREVAATAEEHETWTGVGARCTLWSTRGQLEQQAVEGQGAVDADREGGLRDGLVPTTMPTPAHVQLAIARRRAGLPEIKGLGSKSTEWVNSEMG
jgi:hypothetical protein